MFLGSAISNRLKLAQFTFVYHINIGKMLNFWR